MAAHVFWADLHLPSEKCKDISLPLLQRLRYIICGIRGWNVGRNLDVLYFLTRMVTKYSKCLKNYRVLHELWNSMCNRFIFLHTILSVRHVLICFTLTHSWMERIWRRPSLQRKPTTIILFSIRLIFNLGCFPISKTFMHFIIISNLDLEKIRRTSEWKQAP